MRNVLRGLLFLLACGPLQSCLRERYGPAECRSCQDESRGMHAPSGVARVLIIENTSFEARGLKNILDTKETRPKYLPSADQLTEQEQKLGLQARYVAPRVIIEIVNLAEAIRNAGADPRLSKNQLSALKEILARPPLPALVIALGTAAYPDAEVRHGSVYGGSSVFIHSQSVSPPNDEVRPLLKPMGVEYDQVLPSPVGARFIRSLLTLDWGRLRVFLDTVSRGESPSEEQRRLFVEHNLTSRLTSLKQPPHFEGKGLEFILDSEAVTGSSVNVEPDGEFRAVDEATFRAYNDRREPNRMVSIEATHGLIRACCPPESAFVFISGITKRMGNAEDEASIPNRREAVSTNAGNAAAFVLEMILENEGLLP